MLTVFTVTQQPGETISFETQVFLLDQYQGGFLVPVVFGWCCIPWCEVTHVVILVLPWSSVGNSQDCSRHNSALGFLQNVHWKSPFQWMAGPERELVQKIAAFSYPPRKPKTIGKRKKPFILHWTTRKNTSILVFVNIKFFSNWALEIHVYIFLTYMAIIWKSLKNHNYSRFPILKNYSLNSPLHQDCHLAWLKYKATVIPIRGPRSDSHGPWEVILMFSNTFMSSKENMNLRPYYTNIKI